MATDQKSNEQPEQLETTKEEEVAVGATAATSPITTDDDDDDDGGGDDDDDNDDDEQDLELEEEEEDVVAARTRITRSRTRRHRRNYSRTATPNASSSSTTTGGDNKNDNTINGKTNDSDAAGNGDETGMDSFLAAHRQRVLRINKVRSATKAALQICHRSLDFRVQNEEKKRLIEQKRRQYVQTTKTNIMKQLHQQLQKADERYGKGMMFFCLLTAFDVARGGYKLSRLSHYIMVHADVLKNDENSEGTIKSSLKDVIESSNAIVFFGLEVVVLFVIFLGFIQRDHNKSQQDKKLHLEKIDEQLQIFK